MPEKPKGRLLMFWGCGEHAPKGQPVVIDFAKLAAGQAPPGLWSTTIVRDWGPTPDQQPHLRPLAGRGWQVREGRQFAAGPHRIVGNYSPEIAFTLTKDFMAALRVSKQANQPSGALVTWNAMPDATGYLATLVGGKQGPRGDMGDMVMWSSSATRQFGGGLDDWLTPAQVAGWCAIAR
jgi:hypothetical protein